MQVSQHRLNEFRVDATLINHPTVQRKAEWRNLTPTPPNTDAIRSG
jgi:hypothetical protein